MERVFEVLEMPPDKPDAAGRLRRPRPWSRRSRFERVGFEYRPGVPVLRDVHLTVPGGSTVALVGPSGAGKTTLTDLVARFHDPDGRRRSSSTAPTSAGFKLAGYRGLLAVVQQDVVPVRRHVRENIAYGRRGASRGADRRRRPPRQRPRVHRATARGLRHPHRRARLQTLRRPEAAAEHRPRDPGRPANPHPRRGDEQPRHRERAADPGRASPTCSATARRSSSPTA